ncbi:MAG: hypothetical protein PHW87_13995 [Methanothrix sp.]|nr:hypothetical protein [Methanothrix sp.]
MKAEGSRARAAQQEREPWTRGRCGTADGLTGADPCTPQGSASRRRQRNSAKDKNCHRMQLHSPDDIAAARMARPLATDPGARALDPGKGSDMPDRAAGCCSLRSARIGKPERALNTLLKRLCASSVRSVPLWWPVVTQL